MRVLRERMDSLSELMDELMLRQVAWTSESHGAIESLKQTVRLLLIILYLSVLEIHRFFFFSFFQRFKEMG